MYGSRYQKKKPPYGVLAVLLCLLLMIGYCVSGIYKIPGANILNLEENLKYVFMHPFTNWNDKTPAFLAVAFLIWLILVSYILYYSRNFQTEMEHGDENWLDVEAACRELEDEDEKYNRILSENLKVSLRGSLSNNNMLAMGSSGSYKTTALMHQNMLQFGSSYVILDVKGDTQRKLGKAMQRARYTIRSLNFKEPEKSDRINPFVNIEREHDLLRVIKALQEACRPQKSASMADPFWDDGVRLYLQSLFFYAWLDARDRGSVE